MARYHIKADGTPGVCHAGTGKCPYGGVTNHFETLAEASKVANERQLAAFIRDDNKNNPDFNEDYREIDTSMVDERELDSYTMKQEFYIDKNATNPKLKLTPTLVNELKNNGWGSRNGLDGETYAGVAYAQDLNCLTTLVSNGNGTLRTVQYDPNTQLQNNDFIDKYKEIQDNISKKLTDNGVVLTNIRLIKSMHLSNDGKTAVVQMGAPNVPDLAIIKDGNIEFVEVKDLRKQGEGSQIDSISANVNSDNVSDMDKSKFSQKIVDDINLIGFAKTAGTNVTLNHLTYNDSLQYFIDTQKEEGISRFAYIGNDTKLHDVSLSASTEDIANKLEKDKIRATLIMRSNMTSTRVSLAIKKHWKDNRSNYFKENNFPDTGKMTLSDIDWNNNKDQISLMKGKLCMGEMVLPFKIAQGKEKLSKRQIIQRLNKLDKYQEFSFSQVKARQLTFIGNLKQVTKDLK